MKTKMKYWLLATICTITLFQQALAQSRRLPQSPNWYVYSDAGKVFRNDQQIAEGFQGIGDIAVSGNHWYIITEDGKVYRNGTHIMGTGYSKNSRISAHRNDWYVITPEGKLFKNGKSIFTLTPGVGDVAVTGKTWYVMTPDGRVLRNGAQIGTGYAQNSRIAASGENWYVFSDGKIFRNGQELTGGGSYVGDGDIAAVGEDWYLVSMTGKVYKNHQQIAEGYPVYNAIAVE
jgi:hypothetical protein